MPKRTLTALIVGTLLNFASVHAAAQAPARKDQRPLEREVPISSVKGSDVVVTVTWLAELVKQQGFAVTSQNFEKGEVRATKTDGAGEDRIIAWVERSLLEPQTRFNVYFMAGYFSKFFGTTDFPRLLLDPSDETRKYGPVRQAIIADASSRQ